MEFNCRFGDPETQAVLPLLESDLFELLAAAARGDLGGLEIRSRPGAACCVVLAAGGYPGPYEKGKVIHGLEQASGLSDLHVFHAGTRRLGGQVVSSGGRVLGVTGTGAVHPRGRRGRLPGRAGRSVSRAAITGGTSGTGPWSVEGGCAWDPLSRRRPPAAGAAP